jgi:hypothetical protein
MGRAMVEFALYTALVMIVEGMVGMDVIEVGSGASEGEVVDDESPTPIIGCNSLIRLWTCRRNKLSKMSNSIRVVRMVRLVVLETKRGRKAGSRSALPILRVCFIISPWFAQTNKIIFFHRSKIFAL